MRVFKHFSDSSEEIFTNLRYVNPKILALRAISFLYFFGIYTFHASPAVPKNTAKTLEKLVTVEKMSNFGRNIHRCWKIRKIPKKPIFRHVLIRKSEILQKNLFSAPDIFFYLCFSRIQPIFSFFGPFGSNLFIILGEKFVRFLNSWISFTFRDARAKYPSRYWPLNLNRLE